MPTYLYRCKSCSQEFDEFQRIADEPLKTCPSCKKDTLIRIIGGGAGLLFKGSGFYQTDYKKSGEEGKKESVKKKETKVDAKPESKSDTSTEKKSSDAGSAKPKGEKGEKGE
jgi:putative FmdB family regulatory protein